MPHTLAELNKHHCLIGSKVMVISNKDGNNAKEIKNTQPMAQQFCARVNRTQFAKDSNRQLPGLLRKMTDLVSEETKIPCALSINILYSGVWLVYPKVRHHHQNLQASVII